MENVYSNSLLRIGDEVIMKMDPESRAWGCKGVPDGTKGTVVGFKEYFISEDINCGKKIKPGMYRANGAAFVQWEEGTTSYESTSLAIPGKVLEQRREDKVYRELFGRNVFFEDLPKLPYMVGNIVEINVSRENEVGVISFIDYTSLKETRDDGTEYPIYDVRLESGGSMRLSSDQIIRVIESGNYHAWLNDRSLLKFKDLKDEVAFYGTLGMTEQLINPRTKNYGWEIKEIVEAVKRGEVDLISTSGSLFGSTPFPTAYKLDPELSELAERTRAEIIKGFSN